MFKELYKVSLSIKQIFGEIPPNLVIRRQSLQILVKRACVLSNNILFGKNWERHTKSRPKPFLDLSFGPRFLRCKLITRNGNDQETSLLIGTIHFLILSIVPISEASQRSYIDQNYSSYITLLGNKVSHSKITFFSEATHLQI